VLVPFIAISSEISDAFPTKMAIQKFNGLDLDALEKHLKHWKKIPQESDENSSDHLVTLYSSVFSIGDYKHRGLINKGKNSENKSLFFQLEPQFYEKRGNTNYCVYTQNLLNNHFGKPDNVFEDSQTGKNAFIDLRADWEIGKIRVRHLCFINSLNEEKIPFSYIEIKEKNVLGAFKGIIKVQCSAKQIFNNTPAVDSSPIIITLDEDNKLVFFGSYSFSNPDRYDEQYIVADTSTINEETNLSGNHHLEIDRTTGSYRLVSDISMNNQKGKVTMWGDCAKIEPGKKF
jgi:hypothetical protein